MWQAVWAKHGIRPRDAIWMLTLVSHLLVTFGFPLPAPSRPSKDASRPFPCQNRPCGCLTADECWKGDCCCFTLEGKVTWAEANGIEPPDHVRPLVESRKARPSPPKTKSCCSAAEDTETGEPTESPPCCSTAERSVQPSCCGQEPNCCKKKLSKDRPGVRWVVGVFARKCRGEGPVGSFELEPAIFPDLTSDWLRDQSAVTTLTDRPRWLTSTSHSPPTPPPRQA